MTTNLFPREVAETPVLSAGVILRRTCQNSGNAGWQLYFVKNAASLAMHFSDRLHGGSAPSRAAAQRALDELKPLFHNGPRRQRPMVQWC